MTRASVVQVKFPERILVLRAQTVADTEAWLVALKQASEASKEAHAAQPTNGAKMPPGLESLRKVSCGGCSRGG